MRSEYSNYFEYGLALKTNECFVTSKNKVFNYKKCLFLSENKKNVLVFGDSYSNHLMPGLRKAYPNINFLQASASGCVPTVGNEIGAFRCLKLKEYIIKEFLPSNGNKISSVIISFKRWWEVGLGNVHNTFKVVKGIVPRSKIMSPNIHYNVNLPYILHKGDRKKRVLSQDSHLIADRQFDLNKKAKKLFLKDEYVDLLGQICNGGKCKTLVDDVIPLIYDHGHFTKEGSSYLIQRLKSQLNL